MEKNRTSLLLQKLQKLQIKAIPIKEVVSLSV